MTLDELVYICELLFCKNITFSRQMKFAQIYISLFFQNEAIPLRK